MFAWATRPDPVGGAGFDACLLRVSVFWSLILHAVSSVRCGDCPEVKLVVLWIFPEGRCCLTVRYGKIGSKARNGGACRIMEWGVTFLFVRGVRLWFCLDGNWKLLECNVVFTIFLLLADDGQGQLGL